MSKLPDLQMAQPLRLVQVSLKMKTKVKIYNKFKNRRILL